MVGANAEPREHGSGSGEALRCTEGPAGAEVTTFWNHWDPCVAGVLQEGIKAYRTEFSMLIFHFN